MWRVSGNLVETNGNNITFDSSRGEQRIAFWILGIITIIRKAKNISVKIKIISRILTLDADRRPTLKLTSLT
jgi:hypothetical protein